MDRGKLERQIGRLLERNTRAAGRYTIDLVDDRARPAGLALQWSARAEWDEWARHSEGCYVLRTNIADWDVRLAARQSALQKQYSALEVALGKLKNQSTWLAGQVNQLSNNGSSS